ncbi:MAG: hypothetical protein methR_P0587 [Methyloprofundus sp.]|nr:MAG: hypothetical protein methR_P0587 [Methyloprofundus sp.]
MKKKAVLPSREEIENNKSALAEYLKKIISGTITVRTKKETVSDRLKLLSDELLLMKGQKMPYSILCTIVTDKTGLQVSEQTLRKFCQENLDFPRAKDSNTADRSRGSTLTKNLKATRTGNRNNSEQNESELDLSGFDNETV